MLERMDEQAALEGFSAIAHQDRLRIVRMLVVAGADGIPNREWTASRQHRTSVSPESIACDGAGALIHP